MRITNRYTDIMCCRVQIISCHMNLPQNFSSLSLITTEKKIDFQEKFMQFRKSDYSVDIGQQIFTKKKNKVSISNNRWKKHIYTTLTWCSLSCKLSFFLQKLNDHERLKTDLVNHALTVQCTYMYDRESLQNISAIYHEY